MEPNVVINQTLHSICQESNIIDTNDSYLLDLEK